MPQFRGDSCWYWCQKLLDGGVLTKLAGRGFPPAYPGSAASTEVEEINVRLKKEGTDEGMAASNG